MSRTTENRPENSTTVRSNLALEIAHEAYVLETGKVALSGPAKEIAGHPDVKRAYLGA